MTLMLWIPTSGSSHVLGWRVHGQTGPALLLHPPSTGAGAGGPGAPGPPRAADFSVHGSDLLLLLRLLLLVILRDNVQRVSGLFTWERLCFYMMTITIKGHFSIS